MISKVILIFTVCAISAISPPNSYGDRLTKLINGLNNEDPLEREYSASALLILQSKSKQQSSG